ncbi:MAG: hypothetical protein H7X94_05695, partial [Vallitaleaceae bacterium]|nr:hypothetical protein [Vallitaleaceae bacterium]
LGKEVAPSLLIEHARNCGPLNDDECPWDTPLIKRSGLFKEWGEGNNLKKTIEFVEFSEIFRTYDVSVSLTVPSTLDRVVELFNAYSETGNGCLLNCESEPFIGAVLGCAIGVMSSMYQNNIVTSQVTDGKNFMLEQFIRAVRWQRIAPAWGVGIGKSCLDTNYLSDNWDFRKGSDWVDYFGVKLVKQLAPARVSRGMELPEVDLSGDEAPYVICSKHPSGAISVASLPRINVESGRYYPKASVELTVAEINKPIGIFGKYERVTLNLQGALIESQTIWAQDLMKEEAIDITSRVALEGNRFTISGKLLEELCSTTDDIDDAPGVVLAFTSTFSDF